MVIQLAIIFQNHNLRDTCRQVSGRRSPAPGSSRKSRTHFLIPARPTLALAATLPASSLQILCYNCPISLTACSLCLCCKQEKNEPLQISRDIGLLGKKKHKPIEQLCSNKSCECWVDWDSNSGTGLLFWAAPAQLWRDRGGLSNIPFFVSHESSFSVLNKNSKTKRILLVSFSKWVCICEFSLIEDWLFFLPSLFLHFPWFQITRNLPVFLEESGFDSPFC